MFKKLFELQGNDTFLKIASAIVAVAVAVKSTVPEHTVAFKISDQVLQIAIVLGISSTTYKSSK